MVTIRPKRFTPGELKKVGVRIVDKNKVHLKCEICGSVWSPNLLSGGRLPGGTPLNGL